MRALALSVAVVLVGACGSGGAGGTAGPDPATSPDPAAYGQAASAAATALDTYCAAAAGMTSIDDCGAAVQPYVAAMSEQLAVMQEQAPAMDARMRAMGQGAAADFTCGVGVMQQLMAQHMGAACAGADVAADQAEAAQHCAAMQVDVDHMQMRAAGMQSMMAGGGGGGMMGGWPMPGGGTMPWSHAMPGCATATAP